MMRGVWFLKKPMILMIMLLATSISSMAFDRVESVSSALWSNAYKAKISLIEAVRIATQAVSGMPVRAFLSRVNQVLVYKVVVVDNRSRTWTVLTVDAMKGRVATIKTYRLGSKNPRLKK